MTDLDALAALLAAATRRPWSYSGPTYPDGDQMWLVGDGNRAQFIAWADASNKVRTDFKLAAAAVNALPSLIEAARREAAARFVAEHWRDSCMERIDVEGSQWAIATHPLAMVLGALDGETDPRQLGLPESVDEAFRALLHDNAGAAARGNRTLSDGA